MMKKTAASSQSLDDSSSKRCMILLTNTAFLPFRSRLEEDEYLLKNLAPNEDVMDPKHHCRSFTGVDFHELAYVWLALIRNANMRVDLVSPRGGAISIDPDSLFRLKKDERLVKEICKEMPSVEDFATLVSHTWPINAVRSSDYSLAVIVGSHGAMFDLPRCERVNRILNEIYYENNGYIATIGHGAAALINVPSTESPATKFPFLIRDKKIACATNREAKSQNVDKYLPFLLEDKLKERGAQVQEADPFKSNVVFDERLITAQSAPSLRDFIKKIGEKILGKSIEI